MEPIADADAPLLQNCPSCATVMDVTDVEPLSAVICPTCGTPSVVSATIDHFELVDVIGHGGMGAVYKGHDTSLDRLVALKLLRKSSGSPEQIAQLETEAAITASINHPHVVRVFSTGMDRGRFYIAMELVEKGTLDSLIELQGRVAEAQVLEVAIQIASGLRAAQHAGLIHRDVKPGNILFADAHTAKIVDFGLAIFAEDEAKVRGEIWGTPYYVAPEKLDHKPEDFRSDIYSLGGTLFHALAGRPPFEAENASMVALKHLKSQAVSLQAFAPHVSGNTAYVINRTLAKDPDQRYQSYDELIEHLEYAQTELQANGGKPQQSRRVVMESETEKKATAWVTLAALGLILLVGIGAFIFRDQLFSGDTASDTELVKRNTTMLQGVPARLVAGKAAEVQTTLADAAAQKPPQPALNWISVYQGLSQLVAGNRADSMDTFSKLAARGPFSKKDADAPLAQFFVEVGKRMGGEEPIDPKALPPVNSENYQAASLLLYGLKDWDVGDIDDGAELLRRFRKAAPAGQDAWISSLDVLAASYLDEFSSWQKASDAWKAAKTVPEKKAAIAALKAVKGKFAPRALELAAKSAANLAQAEKEQAALFAKGEIPPGRYKLTNRKTGKTIEVEGHSRDDGHKVYQLPYADSANQQWDIAPLGGGFYLLTGAESGKALNVTGGQTDENIPLQQSNVTKGPSQKWKIEPTDGGFYKFTAACSGKVISVLTGANGSAIVQTAFTGAPEQQWKLEPL